MRTIAVVEDSADNRLLLRALLGDRYAIDAYAAGPDALAAWEVRAPELVLLDITLPDMDGMEVLRRLRATPHLRAVPVVALTAHAMAGDRERFLAAGFDAYLSKPIVDEEELYGLIERLLGRA